MWTWLSKGHTRSPVGDAATATHRQSPTLLLPDAGPQTAPSFLTVRQSGRYASAIKTSG